MKRKWLNRTVLGIGLTSLLSDCSHEAATSVLPAFLGSLGVAAAWLGLIEGVADGLSSIGKLASGYYTDRLERRQPVAVVGYVVTALGTASFGLASAAWQVLVARSSAWLGRGVRTPIRKALLSGSVEPETYGRAFGFERMMDTLGAIVGPALGFYLIHVLYESYAELFAWTLVPGLLAVCCMAFLVQEKRREKVRYVSFGESLRALPASFRRLVQAVAVFGAGDFAHSLLILLASTRLAPILGAARAATVAVGLYLLHNVVYCAFAVIGGRLADRLPKRRVLACAYLLAAAMALCVVLLPPAVSTYAAVFALGGIYFALNETAEDSFAAELVDPSRHGVAFGVLATVNGLGDFVSSVVVGGLWTLFGTGVAFSYSAVLSLLGAALLLRAGKGA